MARPGTPEVVPVLSRGKHRSPRKGACFMEYVSLLAGERWSDHPRCTHPLLAYLARLVNDYTTDEARSRLLGLIPSVIGLNEDEPGVDVAIAVRCAATAIPVVTDSRQRALAVSLLAAQRVLGDLDERTDPRANTELSDRARRALASVPHATRWAEEFSAQHGITLKAFRKRSAPASVRVAVVGIAEAAISDPDGLLYELLARAVDDCTDRLRGRSRSVTTAPEAMPSLLRPT